jgi:hypothetical protein
MLLLAWAAVLLSASAKAIPRDGFGLATRAVLAAAIWAALSAPPAGAGQAPRSIARPSIQGTTAAGKTLKALNGAWRPRAKTFHYRWKRCNAAGLRCRWIRGATARRHRVRRAEIGHTLRVAVRASNAHGSRTAASPATAKVRRKAGTAARPYFVGDFETGDLSQWPYLGDAHGVSVVSSPASGGGSRYAARAVTTSVPDSSDSGDASYVAMGSFRHPWQNDGADAWFRILVLFPSGNNPAFPGKFTPNPMSSGWNMFMEWHNSPGDGPASPYVGVWNNGNGTARLMLRLVGGDAQDPAWKWLRDRSLLRYDRWYDVLVRIRWSSDPAIGYVGWWVNGRKKFGGHFPTLYRRPDGTASSVSFQVGHYRRTVPHTDTLYFDGVKVGPTRGSVGSG